jgi:hypothetical protein
MPKNGSVVGTRVFLREWVKVDPIKEKYSEVDRGSREGLR